MHPSDEIRGVKSRILFGKKIVLGVTGSIAAVECIKLSRELIRHGAEVFPVMTPSATKIIHPDSLEFATGNKPIIELSGAAEHVSLCGKVESPADLLLIAPCTANTISKISHGIDDTSVTTFATTAIGSGMNVVIVPAMHLSMYDDKIIQNNITKLRKMGIKFIEPQIDRNKAKLPDLNKVVANVIRACGKGDFFGRKLLVIGGATAEAIDDVRVVTNRSSGKTAVSLAVNAFYRGADVELWMGWNRVELPSYIRNKSFETVNDIKNLIKKDNLKDFDIIILCAAIADYIPEKHLGKISSGKEKIVIEMFPAEKIIRYIRKISPNSKIVGFKVEDTSKNMKDRGYDLLVKNNLDLVVGNLVSGFGSDKNEIWIINAKGSIAHKKGSKDELSNFVLDHMR